MSRNSAGKQFLIRRSISHRSYFTFSYSLCCDVEIMRMALRFTWKTGTDSTKLMCRFFYIFSSHTPPDAHFTVFHIHSHSVVLPYAYKSMSSAFKNLFLATFCAVKHILILFLAAILYISCTGPAVWQRVSVGWKHVLLTSCLHSFPFRLTRTKRIAISPSISHSNTCFNQIFSLR